MAFTRRDVPLAIAGLAAAGGLIAGARPGLATQAGSFGVPVIIPADESDPRRYVGHLFDWKVVGSSTGAHFALVEVTGWKGGEPPMHYHTREEEFFYVLDGEATFRVGDLTRRVGPGGFVWGPRLIPHGFVFESDIVRLLIGFLPAGQEATFQTFSSPAPDRAPPAPPAFEEMPDMAAVQAFDEALGVVYVGPPLAEILATERA
ncbi:MAG: cupin domain-containing protein [Bauldia sp.]|nr:cupin domain-containing protein [Bauldia sp.]